MTIEVPAAQPDPGSQVPIVDQFGRQWLHDPATGRWTLIALPPELAPKEKTPPNWWLRVIALTWALLLVGLAYWHIEYGNPTIREQSDVEAAQPAVDGAIAKVLAIVGPEPVVSISGYRSIAGCELTKARDGAIYARTLHVYTPPGTELALIDRIGAGLPESFKAKVTKVIGSGRLSADAGDFVKLRAAATGTGDIEVVADTGCRPIKRPDGGPDSAISPDATPTDQDKQAAATLLATLGTAPQTIAVHRFGCIRTVETVSQNGVSPGRLDERIGKELSKDDPTVLLADDRVAYRRDGVDIAVRASGDTVTVTQTSRC